MRPTLVVAMVLTLLLALHADAQPPQRTGIPAVVAKVRPAVVNIATRQVSYDALLRAVPAQGLGSGVLFDARGYVLTNSHVVQGAQEIRVTLTDGRAFPGKVLDTAWLDTHLTDANLRVVDMVTERSDYRRGHIPGAVYLNVDDARIKVPAGGFRLPTAEEAARLVRDLGIGPSTHVVIYDDSGGLHAARLFFTLDVFGHWSVSLLDGGIQAWRRAKLPTTAKVLRVARTDYQPVANSDRVANAEWVRDRLKDPTHALVDTKRGGHIPGAINIEWEQNLRPDGIFKWSEWGNRDDLPVAR